MSRPRRAKPQPIRAAINITISLVILLELSVLFGALILPRWI